LKAYLPKKAKENESGFDFDKLRSYVNDHFGENDEKSNFQSI